MIVEWIAKKLGIAPWIVTVSMTTLAAALFIIKNG